MSCIQQQHTIHKHIYTIEIMVVMLFSFILQVKAKNWIQIEAVNVGMISELDSRFPHISLNEISHFFKNRWSIINPWPTLCYVPDQSSLENFELRYKNQFMNSKLLKGYEILKFKRKNHTLVKFQIDLTILYDFTVFKLKIPLRPAKV